MLGLDPRISGAVYIGNIPQVDCSPDNKTALYHNVHAIGAGILQPNGSELRAMAWENPTPLAGSFHAVPDIGPEESVADFLQRASREVEDARIQSEQFIEEMKKIINRYYNSKKLIFQNSLKNLLNRFLGDSVVGKNLDEPLRKFMKLVQKKSLKKVSEEEVEKSFNELLAKFLGNSVAELLKEFPLKPLKTFSARPLKAFIEEVSKKAANRSAQDLFDRLEAANLISGLSRNSLSDLLVELDDLLCPLSDLLVELDDLLCPLKVDDSLIKTKHLEFNEKNTVYRS